MLDLGAKILITCFMIFSFLTCVCFEVIIFKKGLDKQFWYLQIALGAISLLTLIFFIYVGVQLITL